MNAMGLDRINYRGIYMAVESAVLLYIVWCCGWYAIVAAMVVKYGNKTDWL